MRYLSCLALSFALGGCMFNSISPAQRASDAARETNVATRFGQIEIALSHVASTARDAFLERRAQWGQTIRILEVEMMGMSIVDEEHATATVSVSWSSVNDSLLRSTSLTQDWEYRKANWVLVRERRQSGDLGLFGESMPDLMPPHPDVHRPSRSLGSN